MIVFFFNFLLSPASKTGKVQKLLSSLGAFMIYGRLFFALLGFTPAPSNWGDLTSDVDFIPEFSSWMILPALLSAAIGFMLCRKKTPRKISNS
jgi:hypothetical protein